ncbi:MAG: response regulator [Planctomycetota bacterium]|nr:MAG: response regulator [Planctomycetota bacterium]
MASSIMVVEDNPKNMMLICDLLEYKGYQTISCYNAQEALEKLKSIKPSLILMDIQLPQIDGLTLTAKIREMPGMEKVPIVAVTALAMENERKRILESGCNGYIVKPINTRSFVKEIEAFLKEKKE